MTVVQSLFGPTPEQIQAQQRAAMQQEALQFSQMSPMQQAQYGIFSGANMLGGGIASAMVYKDPAIKAAEERKGMLGGVTLGDPASLRDAAQKAWQAGNYEVSQGLLKQAQEMEESTAKISADKALAGQRSREANPVMELVKTGKYTPQSLQKFAQTGDVADLEFKESERGISFSTDAQEVARELYGKAFGELTPTEAAAVNTTVQKRKEARAASGASRTTNVLKPATDVAGQISSFQKLTEPQREMLRSAETAKSMINEASKANNSQAWEAARTQVAKAIGESKLSNEDIRRTGMDPRLIQGAMDWINKKVEGVPNQDIMRQLFAVATLLEQTSTERINATAIQARNVARSVGMEGDIDLLFPTVGSGGSQGNAVDWSTLK
jgi:hypothetical protein